MRDSYSNDYDTQIEAFQYLLPLVTALAHLLALVALAHLLDG